MSGNWDKPAVPKLGWVCLEVYDSVGDSEPGEYDEDSLWFTCQMCEAKLIRYVHVMAHQNWQGELSCGCVCAGHMEGDGDRAKHREHLARRRQRFPSHANWHYSEKGNLYIRVEHHVLVVHKTGDGRWKVWMTTPDKGAVPGRKLYTSKRQAQMGAFDALIWSQTH